MNTYHNRKQIKKKERNSCKKNHVDISIKLTKRYTSSSKVLPVRG